MTTKKERLLTAAKELFSTYGYTETTFKKISERAGVALGLLTHHYGNKEKLFLAAGLDVLEHFLDRLNAATASQPDGYAATLSFCRAYLDFSIDPDSHWLVLVRCSPYSDMKTVADRDIMNSKFEEVHNLLAAQLSRGVSDGSIRDLNPHVTAHIIIATMVGANRTCVLTPYAPPHLYDETLRFVARAVSPA